MSNIIQFKSKPRLEAIELERWLRSLERLLPLLRKHIKELVENPTELHMSQVRATLDGCSSCGDYLRFYTTNPFIKEIKDDRR